MSHRLRRIGPATLALLAGAALLAPWLGLRDPNAQPDGLVLRDLPPGASVWTVALVDDETLYASEIRPVAGGGLEILRGEHWRPLGGDRLDGSAPRRIRFLLGTDGYGRDLLSRVIHGARVSLGIGVVAALIAVCLGTGIGLTAGLAGGWIDGLLMRGTDLMLSVPRLFLALALVAAHGPALATTVAVLAATTWMAAARLMRGQVLTLRARGFAQAARASGAGPVRLAVRHLLPVAVVPLAAEMTLRVGDTILLEAALSFLGLGVPPPTPSWGNLVADGRHGLPEAWWISTLPGLAIAATVLSLQASGEALRASMAGSGRVRQAPAPVPLEIRIPVRGQDGLEHPVSTPNFLEEGTTARSTDAVGGEATGCDRGS